MKWLKYITQRDSKIETARNFYQYDQRLWNGIEQKYSQLKFVAFKIF